MSAQERDLFIYNGVSYYLVGVDPIEKFFSINKLGIYPVAPSTANWRGFIATFAVSQGQLILKDLITNNGNIEGSLAIELNGIIPLVSKPNKAPETSKWREWHYNNVNLLIPYTGKVIITDRYNNYGHTAFYEPSEYFGDLIILSFTDGELTGEEFQKNKSSNFSLSEEPWE